jgi:hypothetical protein
MLAVQESTVSATNSAPSVPNLDAGIYAVGQTLIWIFLFVVGMLLVKRQIGVLFNAILLRLRSGASVRVGSLELGALPQVHQGGGVSKRVRGIVETREDDGSFDQSRNSFRTEFRNLFLVHRIAPSNDPEQLYDIVIYIVPSLRHGSLSCVIAVEYYMGRYWGRTVFRSIDRATGFLIATAAYAPFTCTARVHFSDGTSVFLHRYVDFEMGQLRSQVFREADV